MLTAISIGTGILGGLAGVVLLMPSVMAWDSGNPPWDLKLLGYSGLSVLPITVLTTILTIITQNKLFFSLYLIPISGIAFPFIIAFIKEKFITK